MGEIIVIDDDGVTRDALSVFLSRKGHAVRAAADGPGGVALFREKAADLVILDRNLPGLSGSRVFAAIRQLSPSVPVLVVTGYADAAAEAAYDRLGAAGFLSKADGLSPVLEAAERILAGGTPPARAKAARRPRVGYRRYLFPALALTAFILAMAAFHIGRRPPALKKEATAGGPAAAAAVKEGAKAPAPLPADCREAADRVALALEKYSDRPAMKEFLCDLEKCPEAAGILADAGADDLPGTLRAMEAVPCASALARKYMARPDFLLIVRECLADPELTALLRGPRPPK